ncbi:hypothetical protein ES705_37442 [subsurface metagenome]
MKEKNLEKKKEQMAKLILFSSRLQDSTTKVGSFFGGFFKACEFIMYLIKENCEIPDFNFIQNLWEEIPTKMHDNYYYACFTVYERWKRTLKGKQEFATQLDKELFKVAVNNKYKEFKKRNERR